MADRLYIETSDLVIYDKMNNHAILNKDRKYQMFLAAAFGLQYNTMIPLKNRKDLVRWEYLNEKDRAYLRAIALSQTQDINIVDNESECIRIFEEYANAGVKILNDYFFKDQLGSLDIKFEKFVHDSLKKIEK